jgi:SAM-dependent methyltransferase
MIPRHQLRREILAALAADNLFQPATALWRVYEIEALCEHAALSGRTLDLGCGDGSLTQTVVNQGRFAVDLVGVEPDPADAADARRKGLHSRVHCVLGDAIPERDASFDSAFSNSVLEHIPDLAPVLREVARVLRPGGRFVFTVPSDTFHDCLRGRGPAAWLARVRREAWRENLDRRIQHYRYWTPGEWRDALAAAGLRLDRAERYFPAAAVRRWELVSSWSGGLAYELFGRRERTRQVQRRFRLPHLGRSAPAPAAAAVLRSLSLGALDHDGDSLSGGLLVVATREP